MDYPCLKNDLVTMLFVKSKRLLVVIRSQEMHPHCIPVAQMFFKMRDQPAPQALPLGSWGQVDMQMRRISPSDLINSLLVDIIQCISHLHKVSKRPRIAP